MATIETVRAIQSAACLLHDMHIEEMQRMLDRIDETYDQDDPQLRRVVEVLECAIDALETVVKFAGPDDVAEWSLTEPRMTFDEFDRRFGPVVDAYHAAKLEVAR